MSEGAAGEGDVDRLARDLRRVASDVSSDGLPSGRDEVLAGLASVGEMQSDDPLFKHGRAYAGPLEAPRCTWESDKPPRDDHSCPGWLTASEFEDGSEAGAAKLRQMVSLLEASRYTLLYTGAGISASVVGQAARSGNITVGFERTDLMAVKPTPTHKALAALGKAGLIHSWLQQNHDGLPQKAGFPQELINEIHGSWFDPGNPVVKYNGTLHERAYPWMEEQFAQADLVLVIGTSLGGLTADGVVETVAHRSMAGTSLGAITINLQQTPMDGLMSLRMFGKSDDVLSRLIAQLGMGRLPTRLPRWPTDAALVPYDKDGRLVADGAKRMWLDLSDRQKVRLTPGHNIQGSKQSQYRHIGAQKRVTRDGVTRPAGYFKGDGTVMRREEFHWLLTIEGVQMRLGIWWLDVAIRGAVDVLPLVNKVPRFE